MASKRSSRVRWLVFLGLALATPRADGAPLTEWPVKKDADYGHVSVKNFDDSTPNGHLKINTGVGTTIKAASASTGGDIFANGYTAAADGISARLKTVEDRLAQLRDDFDDTSVAELTDLHDKCTSVHTSLSAKIDALETDINSTAFTPPECSDDTKMRGIVRIDGAWVCMCKKNYTTGTGAAQSDYGTCDVSPCALPNDFLNDANVVQNCAETHLKEGATCTFSCGGDNQPNSADLTATAGAPGTLSCSNGLASGSTHCVACEKFYKGQNCYKGSCDLDALDVSSATNFQNIDCSLTPPNNYMETSDSCNYNCLSDSMPVGVSSIATPGSLSCSNDPVTNPGEEFAPGVTKAGIDSLSPLSTASTPPVLCQSCDDAGKTDYTGTNCALYPCRIDKAHLDSITGGSHDCPESYVPGAADSTCSLTCDDGYVSDDATISCVGITPSSNSADYYDNPLGSTASCTPCNSADNGSGGLLTDYSGPECTYYPCRIDKAHLDGITHGSHNCPASYVAGAAGSTCSLTCDDGYVSDDATISCVGITPSSNSADYYDNPLGSTASCTACDDVAGGDKIDFTGPECTLYPCSIDLSGVTNIDATRTTCGSTMKIGRDTDSVCQVKCADDYVTTNADVDCRSLTALTTGEVAATVSTTCTHCDDVAGDAKLNWRGDECSVAPCQINTATLNGIANIASHDCTSTLPVGQGEDSVCRITCANGYEAQNGVISCEAASTSGTTISVDNVQCVSTG